MVKGVSGIAFVFFFFSPPSRELGRPKGANLVTALARTPSLEVCLTVVGTLSLSSSLLLVFGVSREHLGAEVLDCLMLGGAEPHCPPLTWRLLSREGHWTRLAWALAGGGGHSSAATCGLQHVCHVSPVYDSGEVIQREVGVGVGVCRG
ncbi:hypothetical protein LY76DRAFT_354305 [Colletotrichum caudatum]|nr:hypothetical protein LY76DRAFT_354305 [Colletotrichum caudatum]